MKLRLFYLSSAWLLSCLPAPLFASIVEYGQKLNEADWTVLATKNNCLIRQNIPLFGKAEFEQKYRDTSMNFNIYVDRIPGKTTSAILTAVPPRWNHVSLLRPIGKVELHNKNKALSLEHKLSMRLISELEDGMFPTLVYKSWVDSSNKVQVAISPVNFRDQLPTFLACIARLPLKPVVVVKPIPKVKPLAKKKRVIITTIIEDTDPDTFYFAKNSSKLSFRSKDKLKRFAKRIKKDKKNKHIIVTGYSDDTGNNTQSTLMSKQRAVTVQSYLEQLGIPAKYLFTRYFGRDHAILSNKTEQGRAKNRRVHIDVIHSNLKSPR